MKTFLLGGVHPQENKLTAQKSIEVAALPVSAVFLMNQHIGAMAVPVVKKGDVVKVGTLIAEASGFVSAPVHSSVSGTVNHVNTFPDAMGRQIASIFIDVDGDEWDEAIDRSPDFVSDKSLTSDEIKQRIKNAGIVGLGGACFPTHVKLTPPKDAKAECVIINGVECEPYLTSDHRLMLEKTREVIEGIALLMRAAGVDKAYVGIENNKPDAIEKMSVVAAEYTGIEIVPLKVKYPQGGEKQLIKAITGRAVAAPPALPISVGAIVQNVGTAFAVYEAVMKNKPLFERVVTVTGKGLKNPQNLLVRMGTPLKSVIEACGGMPENAGKIICGGPMMGRAVANMDLPIVKGSSGVLIMSGSDAKRGSVRPCIRCAKCVSACPMGLEPYLLATCSGMNEWDTVKKNDVMSCLECGCCQFACPSNRPLLDLIRVGKNKVAAIIREQSKK